MTIGVLKEPEYESRVSLLPEHLNALQKLGVNIIVESGSGEKSFASDDQYKAAGAEIDNRQNVIHNSNLILSIHPIEENDLPFLKEKTLLGNFQALNFINWVQSAASKNISVFSLDMLPRTTRAQSMDVLSSQANIAGYKAVLVAAAKFPHYFPMFMTAAGSVPPAKMLILGAGVAGLQAIATAKRLGAVVEVFDTRPAVKEEVQSLGAKFIEVEGAADASSAGGYAVEQSEEYQKRQKEKIAQAVAKADVVITTAQIPGRKAPVLITQKMIEAMKPGSVIVDLAASTGGNTELTTNNETIVFNGVSIIGDSNLPASVPADASKLYGKNICNFLPLIIDKEKGLNLNFNDELVKGACIAHLGEITNERILQNLNKN